MNPIAGKGAPGMYFKPWRPYRSITILLYFKQSDICLLSKAAPHQESRKAQLESQFGVWKTSPFWRYGVCNKHHASCIEKKERLKCNTFKGSMPPQIHHIYAVYYRIICFSSEARFRRCLGTVQVCAFAFALYGNEGLDTRAAEPLQVYTGMYHVARTSACQQ